MSQVGNTQVTWIKHIEEQKQTPIVEVSETTSMAGGSQQIEVTEEDENYLAQLEPHFPRGKTKYHSVKNARALMIEMRSKYGYNDF